MKIIQLWFLKRCLLFVLLEACSEPYSFFVDVNKSERNYWFSFNLGGRRSLRDISCNCWWSEVLYGNNEQFLSISFIFKGTNLCKNLAKRKQNATITDDTKGNGLVDQNEPIPECEQRTLQTTSINKSRSSTFFLNDEYSENTESFLT